MELGKPFAVTYATPAHSRVRVQRNPNNQNSNDRGQP
jgi:hypothetical protein